MCSLQLTQAANGVSDFLHPEENWHLPPANRNRAFVVDQNVPRTSISKSNVMKQHAKLQGLLGCFRGSDVLAFLRYSYKYYYMAAFYTVHSLSRVLYSYKYYTSTSTTPILLQALVYRRILHCTQPVTCGGDGCGGGCGEASPVHGGLLSVRGREHEQVV